MSDPSTDSPLKQLLDANKENKHHSRSIWKVILDFCNPFYHVKRFKEDFAVSKAALEKRKQLLSGEASTADLPEIFRGKLLGVFFLTGWTNLIGLGLGFALQKATGSEWIGLYTTPPLCYIVTAIAYQIGWWIDNRKIYRQTHDDPAHRFWELQKDMLPVHRASLPMAVMFGFANLIVATPIQFMISFFSPEVAKEIPSGLLIMIGEFLFIGGAFVRIMGDFFDKYGYKLAIKYRSICKSDSSDQPVS